MIIKHKWLREFYLHGRRRHLPAEMMPRIQVVLGLLAVATKPADMARAGWRLHELKGPRRGQWSVRVSGNWRIVFRFVDGEAVDVDLVDYH